ncbi:MAG: pentapeptide repeat-containing protein [bacterium]
MINFKNILFVSILILSNYALLKAFNEQDLKHLYSGKINLIGSDFSNANLSNMDLQGKNFKKANFDGANLDGARFNKSNFKQAILTNTSAIEANFIGCIMQKADCSNANFNKAKFGNRKIHNWHCADLRKSILTNTNFDGANLDKVDLKDVIVDKNTNFSNSSMFLVNVNRTIFDIVKSENTFLIEKPDDSILDTLITELRELKLEQLKPKKPISDPKKVFEDNTCQICLEEFVENTEIAMLPCGHIFHVECISKWFSQKYECPLCRFRTNWFKTINFTD